MNTGAVFETLHKLHVKVGVNVNRKLKKMSETLAILLVVHNEVYNLIVFRDVWYYHASHVSGVSVGFPMLWFIGIE